MTESTEENSLFEKAFAAIDSSDNVEAALLRFREVYAVTHVTYHLAQTIADRIDAPFVRTTYSPEWVSRYLLKGYVHTDPIAKRGFQSTLPFDWAEVEVTPEAAQLLMDAISHGLGPSGYSIPIVDRANRRALLSINDSRQADWLDFLRYHRGDWLELSHRIHKLALRELYGENDPVPSLGPREVECLSWAAQGKDYKTIAIILAISEHTARDYLKSARYKLGCANIPQAISKAIKLRLIDP